MKARRAFAAGVVSGAAAVALSFLLRLVFGTAFLPELAAQTLFSLTPGFLESRAVENLGPLAKDSAFLGASVINVLLIALIPYGFERSGRTPTSRVRRLTFFMIFPYVVMFALGLIFLQIAQVSTQPPSVVSLLVSLIPVSVIFGIGTEYIAFVSVPGVVCVPEQGLNKPFSKKRRLFIKTALGAAVGATILYYGVGLLFPRQSQASAGEASTILSSGITPNDKFYRVDVNVLAPAVDSKAWTLKLHGLVKNPATITYDQLLGMPATEEYATLECVSNKISGDLMSTARWRGVRLRDMLETAQVSTDAQYLIFTCYDGYDVGIPMDRALMDGTILAYEINGEKLPVEHGFPVRAIVPGLYGMMNAKWVTDIEIVNQTYLGFWQRRGWTNTANYQTGSTMLFPGDSPLLDKFPVPSSVTDVSGNPIPVVGVAFAGDRGISKVEVSTDGGSSWQQTSLFDPLSNFTWVFWRMDWNPPATGHYKIMVRATDKTGQTQTATMRDPFPDGATGYQVVDVRVDSTSGS
jgi:DMSO/TMAO reductase YedYZ molybdopterin-dependent catalytic subunit